MTNSSKQRLVNSFNQVVTAVHNLKTDIATEGKKAFIAEQPEDVKELLNMLDSITSLRNSIDSVASIFKAYQIDLVTETHPSEFPLEQLVKGTKPITNYPIHCFFDIGSTENSINVRVESESEYILCAGSSLPITEGRDLNKSAICKRNSEKLNIITIDGVSDLLLVRDMEFKSANALLSFVTGKRVRNGEKQLFLANKPEITLEKYKRTQWLKEMDNT